MTGGGDAKDLSCKWFRQSDADCTALHLAA